MKNVKAMFYCMYFVVKIKTLFYFFWYSFSACGQRGILYGGIRFFLLYKSLRLCYNGIVNMFFKKRDRHFAVKEIR